MAEQPPTAATANAGTTAYKADGHQLAYARGDEIDKIGLTTASTGYEQSEMQAVNDKVDELIDALKRSGIIVDSADVQG